LTQDELAELVGVHRTYAGTVERGEQNVSLTNICLFALALGVEPAALMPSSR
jgi:transcriptional regulator with XRE-family HTH domain